MGSTGLRIHPIFYLAFPLAFGLGLFADSIGFKAFAFSGVLLAIYGILLVPISTSLLLVFFYIGFEGFLKIVSNYHPVVHVGADLMVITLCLKVLLSRFFSGFYPERFPPLTKLFAVHFTWLLIVIFNPYALSLVSSIAGAKIYASMLILYFFGYFLTRSEKDVRRFMALFIGVAIVHSLVGLYQGYMGPESVIRIHPRYAQQLAKYENFAFRPFGLTNLPGGPAIFLYPVVPFLMYFLYASRSWFLRSGIIAFIPLGINLLLLCQIRSAILKAMIGGVIFLLGSLHVASTVSRQWARRMVFVTAFFGLMLALVIPSFIKYSVEIQEQNEMAIERSLSLFDYDKVKNARRGAWDRLIKYAAEVPFGAGFSRVGAAAGAFSEKNKSDQFFGYKHFFSDNLWLAALVEIGVPGMLILTFLLVMIFYCGVLGYRKIKTPSLKVLHLTLFSSLFSIFIGSYGAEGLLYNPEASFFWFFSGVMISLPGLEEKAKETTGSLENNSETWSESA